MKLQGCFYDLNKPRVSWSWVYHRTYDQMLGLDHWSEYPAFSIWILRAPSIFFSFLHGWLLGEQYWLLEFGEEENHTCQLVSMWISLGNDVEHLVLHLSSRYTPVVEVLNWFGIQWALPRTKKQVMYSWVFRRRRKRPKARHLVPLAMQQLCGWFGVRVVEEHLKGSKMILYMWGVASCLFFLLGVSTRPFFAYMILVAFVENHILV